MTEGVAGRYASALFDLAKEAGSLDKTAAELAAFQAMLNQSADLTRLVRSPVFAAEDQTRALGAVLGKAGISGLTANFLGLLAKNRRLFAVSDIMKGYRTLLARHKGEVTADVTSASPLSEAQLTSLRATLKASLGKDVSVHTRVEPALLGGLIVKVGSRMIDSSIRTKLNSLKNAMKEVR
jgi:F-type H+-transporting ATPase subunit delta